MACNIVKDVEVLIKEKEMVTEEDGLEVAFLCENYDIIVELSKRKMIRGLVCFGIPRNFEWIKEIKSLKFLILCEEVSRFNEITPYLFPRDLDVDVGFLRVLDTSVSTKVLPCNNFYYGLKLNKSGTWIKTNPIHVECTVYFTKTGKTIIKNVHISDDCLCEEDICINVEFEHSLFLVKFSVFRRRVHALFRTGLPSPRPFTLERTFKRNRRS